MADVERWGKRESYLPDWLTRAKIIAGFLEDCETVADLGAGTQMLRPLVRGYVPVDVVSLGPDTVQVDFDKPWSKEDIPSCEGLAIAGLLEHVRDPLGLIRGLSGLGRVWAVSYMDSRYHRHDLVPLDELTKAFKDAGMVVTRTADWARQKVYRLERA